MSDFTAAKRNRELNTLTFLNKAPNVFYFEVHIVLVGARANLYFLDGARGRALFRIVSLLLERVAILIEIGDAAYRRLRSRCDLDQIEALGLGNADGFAKWQDADLGPIDIDYADFRGSDLVIDLDRGFSGWWGSEISTNNAPPAVVTLSGC
ncbi:MAG TPA: hypothetical protein VN867_11240 [Candidatus Binataceae bacterium]|nr:hypothetical protein [Candidatus Binataceae bacterium]